MVPFAPIAAPLSAPARSCPYAHLEQGHRSKDVQQQQVPPLVHLFVKGQLGAFACFKRSTRMQVL